MTGADKFSRNRQTVIGLALGGGIIGAWAMLHLYALFVFFPENHPFWLSAALAALQTWLYVGMFIVAHDAIHGSLAPGRPRLNRAIGRLCCAFYAGFSLDTLARGHHAHHRAPGTPDDPDFDAANPTRFAPWFLKFFLTYFSWRQMAILTLWLAAELALGAPVRNLLLFWAVPALASALQLFLFGTWLPHRHGPGQFADQHRCRSTEFSWLVSLLTCFHFGYHQQHHRNPGLPWWRLPEAYGHIEPEQPGFQAAA